MGGSSVLSQAASNVPTIVKETFRQFTNSVLTPRNLSTPEKTMQKKTFRTDILQ